MIDAERKRQSDKAYRESHKEGLKAYFKEFRERNKETLKAQKAERYLNNKEKILAECKAYRDSNREAINARKVADRKANPDKYAVWDAQSKSRRSIKLPKPTPARDARESNQVTYSTGKPCKKGHVCPRYARNSACVQCHADRNFKWRLASGEQIAQKKQAYEKTTDRIEMRRAKYAASPAAQADAVRRAKEWQALNPEKVKAIANESAKRSCASLSDAYVKSKIQETAGTRLPDIPPVLIEMRRLQIKLHRAIRKAK